MDVFILALWCALGIVLIVSQFKYMRFTCPRCGKPFNRDTIAWPGHTYECLHCSLGMFERCSAEEAQAWRQQDAVNSEPIECMNCGRTIAATKASCLHCGWTYAAEAELSREGGNDEEQIP
jgi:predicted RNA-binding Zn-ribbon protein involved in translation (DUF1610 family)